MTARIHRATLERFGGKVSPLVSAAGTWRERRGLLLRLVDDAGEVGLGEASPLPGYSPETFDDTALALERVITRPLPRIDLGDPLSGIRAALDRVPASAPSARFALETALLDLVARRLGTSVAALLCAEPAASVALTAMLRGDDLEAAAAAARDRGVGALKLKIGVESWADDLARIHAVRRVAPDLPLRVDVNAAWPARLALQRLDALAEAGVAFVEQPTSPDDMAELSNSPVPIAADESLRSAEGRAALAPLLDAGVLAACVLKPAVLGGALACLEIAGAMKVAGVASHLLDGPVALAACAELACALGGALPAGLDRHVGLDAWPAIDIPQLGASDLRSAGVGLGIRV